MTTSVTSFIMFVQLILLAIFGIVLSTPILPSARSDQSKTYPLTFNIDPDVSGPACGRHLLANINIKRLATDPASTSGVCNDIRDYLTHPDGKGNTDVDLIFTCPGQPETEDHGSRPVKVFLNTDANVDTTKDNVDADLTVTNDAEGIRFKTVVSLGIKKTGNSELLWQLIYCY